ncbi:hypothetical protein Cgig2_009963 [Carnegiea gigantea]|uniref:Endonuclease/exonuclease/phosphatase domain-containing protein n=1 Tax=Carnegiea gigantea TaxID=171969 RepID=A0A9Q1Q8B0_9CARY|nr:hypothetical protein Cgig2_009963 [Carnegiea gigantea]
MEKTLPHYARLLIEMPLDSTFPDHIEFINDNGILVRQQVHYEWKPLKCTHSQMFGHDISMCKKMGPEETAREQPIENLGPVTELQHDGFTLVAKRDAARGAPGLAQIESRLKQMIHCHVTQLQTSKKFFISFRYGLNRASQRQVLWQDLTAIAAHMNNAWCIIGDFNFVLYKEDRIGGEEIEDHAIKDFAECLEACELNEMRSTGAYYSWTNKTIWSRIDRVFVNPYWPFSADFTQATYLANGLSDHSPIMIQFHDAPKPKTSFQYCNMWSSHKDFQHIVASVAKNYELKACLHSFQNFLKHLKKLNRDKFGYLHEQIAIHKDKLSKLQQQAFGDPQNETLKEQEQECREHYITILSSVMTLVKQQSKIDWIQYGDDCTRYFFARVKGRKLAQYIYNIRNERHELVEGFAKVGRIILDFYKNLLGKQSTPRSQLNTNIIQMGPFLTASQQLEMCRQFTERDIKEAIFFHANQQVSWPRRL